MVIMHLTLYNVAKLFRWHFCVRPEAVGPMGTRKQSPVQRQDPAQLAPEWPGALKPVTQ